MYKLIKKEGTARRGQFETVHGTVQTPAFMNVATAAAIKGGLSAFDLKDNHCQVMLCNTYHLHLRPSDEVVKKLGGLHKMTRWDRYTSQTAADFRCSACQSCAKSPRRV